MLGTTLYKNAENSEHNIIRKKHPTITPEINMRLFLKPEFLAKFIVIILLGPGV